MFFFREVVHLHARASWPHFGNHFRARRSPVRRVYDDDDDDARATVHIHIYFNDIYISFFFVFSTLTLTEFYPNETTIGKPSRSHVISTTLILTLRRHAVIILQKFPDSRPPYGARVRFSLTTSPFYGFEKNVIGFEIVFLFRFYTRNEIYI